MRFQRSALHFSEGQRNLSRRGVIAQCLLSLDLEQQFDGGTQIGQALCFRLTLPVRARNLETGRPKTAFVGLAHVQNCGQLAHLYSFTPTPSAVKSRGMRARTIAADDRDSVQPGEARRGRAPEARPAQARPTGGRISR